MKLTVSDQNKTLTYTTVIFIAVVLFILISAYLRNHESPEDAAKIDANRHRAAYALGLE
jgi:hypothetical protein